MPSETAHISPNFPDFAQAMDPHLGEPRRNSQMWTPRLGEVQQWLNLHLSPSLRLGEGHSPGQGSLTWASPFSAFWCFSPHLWSGRPFPRLGETCGVQMLCSSPFSPLFALIQPETITIL
ncbi:unnamed protein product [Lupinus luteus]|uniref:Uncharacterized protein n=1 Tax=Lupinus luteus TaxID=3873 RepID=A0AAV1WVP9_LUPLU